jgi:hypothetical protein
VERAPRPLTLTTSIRVSLKVRQINPQIKADFPPVY